VDGDQFTDVTKGTNIVQYYVKCEVAPMDAVVRGAALLTYVPIIKGQR
jgi:hypothetical protein